MSTVSVSAPSAEHEVPVTGPVASPVDEATEAGAEEVPQHASDVSATQRETIAGEDEATPIYEIFSRNVRIPGCMQQVAGENDPEAYRKLPHILNTARTRHTLQGLDEPQLTGVLPVSKGLQKMLKVEQARWEKAQKRAQTLAKAENTSRDDEIKKVEKRLAKEMAELRHLLESENKKLPVDERQSAEDIADIAKKLKWRHWREYDRVITQGHLDAMARIYRLRMLDTLPCYESLHAAEWQELALLEDEEWKAMGKKHGVAFKRLTSALRWGKFVAKVKGSKAMDDGAVVRKKDFDEYASKRTSAAEDAHTKELDMLRQTQAQRRNELRVKQDEFFKSLILNQDRMISNIKLDEMTGVTGASRRGTGTGSGDEAVQPAPSLDALDEHPEENEHVPIAPAEPNAPAEHVAPAEYVAPAEPAAPAEHAAPAEPSAPAEPAAPAEHAAPAEPSAQAEHAAPAEPSAQAEPAAPAEHVAPAEPAAPAEPSAQAEHAAPAEPSAQAEPTAPDAADEPVATAAGAPDEPQPTA